MQNVSTALLASLSTAETNIAALINEKTSMKSGIIYKLTCSCGSTYIGQTRHNLLSRIKEHSISEKSEVCKHILQNPSHCVYFNTPTTLGSENDTARQLILESLFIQEQTSDLNNDSQSSPLMIFKT